MLFSKKELNFDVPKVMGVINLTPDSFSDGGRFNFPNSEKVDKGKVLKEIEKMQIDIQKLTELGEKEKAKIRDNLKIKNLYKSLDDIPNFIKKKVG